jgi:hypothetical protein
MQLTGDRQAGVRSHYRQTHCPTAVMLFTRLPKTVARHTARVSACLRKRCAVDDPGRNPHFPPHRGQNARADPRLQHFVTPGGACNAVMQVQRLVHPRQPWRVPSGQPAGSTLLRPPYKRSPMQRSLTRAVRTAWPAALARSSRCVARRLTRGLVRSLCPRSNPLQNVSFIT